LFWPISTLAISESTSSFRNIRLEDERSCILVIIGCNLKGEKELLAISDGYRESELSWLEMLRDLKARGLKIPPKLAVGDGSLGFWAALGKEFPQDEVAALLGTQDGECSGQVAQGIAGKSQIDDSRDVHGRDQGKSSEGV